MPAFLAPILSFFATTGGKIVLYGMISTIVIALAGGLYYNHNRLIRSEALAKYNAEQYKQALADKEKLTKDLEALQIEADKITEDLSLKTDALRKRDNEIEALIRKSKDAPAAPIFKDVIRRLQRN